MKPKKFIEKVISEGGLSQAFEGGMNYKYIDAEYTEFRTLVEEAYNYWENLIEIQDDLEEMAENIIE